MRLLLIPVLLLASVGFALAQDEATPEATPVIEPLPSGPVTLVTLGDSLTEGAEDELEKGGYPGRLIEQLKASRPGSTLLNLGHTGWNSDALLHGDQGLPSELDEAVKAIKEAIAAKRPALALVWIGSNDLFYLYEYGDPDAEAEQADLENYRRNLDTILEKLTDAGARVAIALLDDQSKRPVVLRGEAFPGTSKAEAKRMSAQVQRYNAIIAEKAAEYGALTVDFYNTTLFTDEKTLAGDGNHPNSAGYDKVTEVWFAALRPLLE
jgi:lysophospholipase L1-like esterase